MSTPHISDEMVRESYFEQARLTQAHACVALLQDAWDLPDRLGELITADFVATLDGQEIAHGHDGFGALQQDRRVQILNLTNVAGFAEITSNAVCRLQDTSGGTENVEITFKFSDTPPLRPLIQTLEIKRLSPASTLDGDEDLMRSRLLSTNHRWHTLVEDPDRTSEPFREIVSKDFVMDYGSGSIHSFKELDEWVRGPASSVGASRHDLVRFDWEQVDADTYNATFVLDWHGMTPSGRRMTAETQHTWTFRNDRSKPFATVEHIHVAFLRPFKVVS